MILGSSWDGHSSPPSPCLSIPGFLGYSDDPGIIPGWTQLTPPPPPVVSWDSWDTRTIPGSSPPPVVSWDSWDTRTIPGSSWDGHNSTPPPPLSEYPGIPGILGRSQDHPGMDTAHPPPPPVGVSWDSWDTRTILGSSWDGRTSPPPPCLSILGFLRYLDDPGIIPGWTQLSPPPPPV